VKVFETVHGTLVQTLKKHQGDIFCICVSQKFQKLFISGADSKVVALQFSE